MTIKNWDETVSPRNSLSLTHSLPPSLSLSFALTCMQLTHSFSLLLSHSFLSLSRNRKIAAKKFYFIFLAQYVSVQYTWKILLTSDYKDFCRLVKNRLTFFWYIRAVFARMRNEEEDRENFTGNRGSWENWTNRGINLSFFANCQSFSFCFPLFSFIYFYLRKTSESSSIDNKLRYHVFLLKDD